MIYDLATVAGANASAAEGSFAAGRRRPNPPPRASGVMTPARCILRDERDVSCAMNAMNPS